MPGSFLELTMGVRPVIDGGYAWVILGACFFMYMLLLGSIKSYGILYSEILTVTNSGAGSTALIGSAASFIQSLTGPFAILLATRYSFRLVCFSGGVTLCIGYVSCAFTNDVMYWYITYSLITGIGCGLAYVPCSTLINYYFEHNRALANGIVLSASGVGGFLFPHIYHILIDQYAISGAMLVLGGIMLNVCVAASFLRQPYEFSNDSSRDVKTKDRENEYGSCKEVLCRKFCACDSNIMKDLTFLSISMAFCLSALSYSAYFYTFPSFLESEHIGKATTVFIFSLTGACEIFARVAMGWFTDLKIISPSHVYGLCMCISGISAFVVPLVRHKVLYYAYAVVIGIFPGSFYALMSIILLETVSLKNLPSAFAVVTIFIAVFSLLGLPCLGWVEDLTGSWDNVFYITGVLQLLAAIIAFFVSRCSKSTDSQDDVEKEVKEPASEKLLEAGIKR
ncbi:monocarboxylate transporter 12-like isoform X2 [Saccostrea cucullata]|uniref:monocarboxylate transporter 12-like isoform X2 n=1 Tax=Saccostrea cuccullata TaxID=36930 RepID=UPI002ED07E24